MTYKVVLSPHAVREYKKLSPVTHPQIQEGIDSLAKNPLSGSRIKKLKGQLREYHCYRSGDYRIIYFVNQHNRIVFVEYIQHRKDIYRAVE